MKRLILVLAGLIFTSSDCLPRLAHSLTTRDRQNVSSLLDNKEVKEFINDMVKNHHFEKIELTKLFSEVKVRPIIHKKNAVPVEQKPWHLYKLMFVTDKRIQQGILFWQQYKEALDRAEIQFGVPASIIVATIGVETKYGKATGNYKVIDALSNLAFAGKPQRKQYFKKELKEFLLLTREQNIDPRVMQGSYSGAIGQPQFMPSSYRYYAINFSGTGKIDLSNNEIDVIGSIANFYKLNGWERERTIAMPVSISGGRYQFPIKKKSITFAELVLANMISNNILYDNHYKVLVLQKNYDKEYWKTFHNFDVIKRYNHSDLYAMSVFQLSYFLSALRGNQNV